MNTWESLRDGASSSRVKRERWFIRHGSRGGRSSRVIIIRQPIKIAARVLAFNINFKLITCIFVSRSWGGPGKIGRYVRLCTALSARQQLSQREREREGECFSGSISVCFATSWWTNTDFEPVANNSLYPIDPYNSFRETRISFSPQFFRFLP